MTVWNNDDSIAVKNNAENILIERVVASGYGLVIGSIGEYKVKNVTFRDCVLNNPWKGIYMKNRWYDNGPVGENVSISDILYENITINHPEHWGIWIGPAQQANEPCRDFWPWADKAFCHISGYHMWSNITLRDIVINNPRYGMVLMGNTSNPIKDLVFDNVVVNNPIDKPFGDYYYCDGITGGIATGGTYPVPHCFTEFNNN